MGNTAHEIAARTNHAAIQENRHGGRRRFPAPTRSAPRRRSSPRPATLLDAQRSRARPRASRGAVLRAVPEDLMRYDARELAELAAAAWSFLAERKPGAPKCGSTPLPSPPVTSGSRPPRCSRSSTTTCRSWSIPCWPSSPSRVSRSAGRASGARRSTRDARRPADRLSRARGRRRRARESLIHIHVERIDDEARARRDRAARIAQVLADVRVARAGLARDDCRGSSEVIAELKANPPPLPADEIAEAIQFLEWLVANNFTLPRRPQLCVHRQPGRARAAASRPGSASCARATPRALRARRPARRARRRSRAFLRRAAAADGHQVDACARACTAASTWTISASSVRRRRQADRRVPHRRPVHLDRLYALDRARSRICAARSTPSSSAPASIRTAIPARRWSTCSRPIRATSCSRSTRTRSTTSRWRSCSSTSGRACACCRGATASTASSRSWSTCRATATTATSARRSATIWPAPITAASARSSRSFRKGRWCASISSSGASTATAPSPTAPRLEQAVGAHRAHLDRRASTDALAQSRTSRSRRARCSSAIATRSRTAIARPIRRPTRSATSG